MFSRFMPMALVLLLVHCSADQTGQMTQVQSRRAFDEDLNQSSEVAVVADTSHRESVEKVSSGDTQPSTPATPTAVNHQPIAPAVDPRQSPAPTSSQPAAAPAAQQPISPIKPADKSEIIAPYSASPRSALPDVVINSEDALTPVSSLAAPAMNPNRLPPKVVTTYKFESTLGSGGDSGALVCDSVDRLSTGFLKPYFFLCSLQDASSLPVTLLPADFSWKFIARNCPSLTFSGIMYGNSCAPGDLASCSPVQPATRIHLDDVDLDACVSMGAQLIYSMVDKKSGKTSVQVLNLTKWSVQ